MKQLKHFSIAVVVALLGVAASETLVLAPKDYKQMALHNEIGESPGWSVSTSGSEKLPSYQKKNRLRALINRSQNRIHQISSNTVDESLDSIDKILLKNIDLKEKEDFGMSSQSESLKLDWKQERCFLDYQLHLKALLENSTTDSSAHKVRK